MNPATLCKRAGEPLSERDQQNGNTWCIDCRETEPGMYAHHGGTPPKRRRVDTQEVLRLHHQGLNKHQIATVLGIADTSAARALKRAQAA